MADAPAIWAASTWVRTQERPPGPAKIPRAFVAPAVELRSSHRSADREAADHRKSMGSIVKLGVVVAAFGAAIGATYVDRHGLRSLHAPPGTEVALAWLRTGLYAFAAIAFVARRVLAPATWVLGIFCLALAVQEVAWVRALVHSGFEVPVAVVDAGRIVFAICVGVIAPCASFASGSFDALAERRGLPFFPRWLVPVIATGAWMLATAGTNPPALGREVGRLLVAVSMCGYAVLAKRSAERTVDLGMSGHLRAERAPTEERAPTRRRRRAA